MISIRNLKTSTSVASVFVTLAASSASVMASEVSRSKLPAFAGGTFTLDKESADLWPAFSDASVGGLARTEGAIILAPHGTATEEYKASWYLDKIHASEAYAMGYTGKGVLAAVVDTGLDVDHTEFAGRISPLSRSFVFGTKPGDLSDVNPDGSINGHGTFSSGLVLGARDGEGIMGVAPDATLMALRMGFDMHPDGSYPPNMAMLHAAANGAQVMNASIQGPLYSSPWVFDSSGKAVRNPNYQVLPNLYVSLGGILEDYETLRKVADSDVVMVFAAGNDRREQPLASRQPSGYGFLPALSPDNHRSGAYTFLLGMDDPDDPNTYTLADMSDPAWDEIDFSDLKGTLITVVALDRNNKLASYSNSCGIAAQWCLAAPGGDFSPDGKFTFEYGIPSTYPYSTYRPWAGTSFAAPVTSGAAAVVRGVFPYLTARQTVEVLLTTATDMGSPERYGWGLLNLGRAVRGPLQFGAGEFPQVFAVDTKGYDSTWSNDIRGTGGLIKRGKGNLVMTGSNTYQGDTNILGGILTLTGSLNSNLSIGTKAILRGSGTINAPVSVAGGVEPGGALGGIGELTVNGNLNLLGTSTYRADVSRRAANDRIVVSGRAALSGGKLEVNLVNGVAPVNSPLNLLVAEGSVDGAFGSFHTNIISAFLDPELAYGANFVSVQFRRNGLSLASAATTANQASIAAAADRLGSGSPVSDALAQNSLSTVGGAFDALSGEVHGSVVTSVYGDASLVSRTLLSRLNPSRVGSGLWGEGLGSWGKVGGNDNAGSIDTATGGFLIGVDAPIGSGYRIGVAGGFTSTDIELDSRLSSATDESVFGAIYGSGRWGAINARLGASLSVHDIDTVRSIGFPGLLDRATASYNATTAQAFGELGYRFGYNTIDLEPFVGASVLRLHTSAFTEDAGIAALTGYGRTYDLATTTLGIRGDAHLGTDLPLTMHGMLGWRHAYGDVAPKALVGLSGGAATFGVSGVPIDRDALVAEASLDWQVEKAVTLGLAYQGQVGSRVQDHALKGSLAVQF